MSSTIPTSINISTKRASSTFRNYNYNHHHHTNNKSPSSNNKNCRSRSSTSKTTKSRRLVAMAYNEDSSASGHDEPWIQW